MQIKIRREKLPKQKMRIRQDLSPQQIREIRLAIREECSLKEKALWQEYGREERHNISEWQNIMDDTGKFLTGRIKRKLPTSDEQFGSY